MKKRNDKENVQHMKNMRLKSFCPNLSKNSLLAKIARVSKFILIRWMKKKTLLNKLKHVTKVLLNFGLFLR